MRKLGKMDVEKSSSVYWSHADWVLSSIDAQAPNNREQLACLLNFHSLFSEYICVPDIMLLNNEFLRDLFFKDYQPLLSNSIVVPMLRSSAKDFCDLDEQFHLDKTAYGMLERTKSSNYAIFLDNEVSAILPTDYRIFSEVLTNNFNQTLLNSDFLREAKLSKVDQKLYKYIDKYYKKYGTEYLRRSAFFFFADELKQDGHPRYAERIKLISTFIYHENFIDQLNLTPELPYKNFEYISNILASNKNKSSLRAKSNNNDLFGEVVFQLKDLSINLSELSHIKPYEIVNIRKSKEAKSYFDGIKKALHECDQFRATNKFIETLSPYLEYLNGELAYMRTGKIKKRTRMQRELKLIKWSGLIGGIAIGLVDPLSSIAFQFLWYFGPDSYFEKKNKTEEMHILSAYEKLKKISFQDRCSVLNAP